MYRPYFTLVYVLNPVPIESGLWHFLYQSLELISESSGHEGPPHPHPHPHPFGRAMRAPERRSPRAPEERMGGCEGSPGPAPCAPIKPRNRSRPFSGFLVTLGGTTRSLPPLVSHRSLDVGVLPERRLRLSSPRSWQIPPPQQVGATGGADKRGGGRTSEYWKLGMCWVRGTTHFGEGPLRVAPHTLGPAVHTAGTAENQSPLLRHPNSEKSSRKPLGARRWAEASPAGPVTRPAGANAAGASLRPGEISV